MFHVYDAIRSKLSGKDAVIFSTLCKYTASTTTYDSVKADLENSEAKLVSFGLWIRNHKDTLRRATLSCRAEECEIVGYLCAACPQISSVSLTLRSFDPIATQLMGATLQHLEIDATSSASPVFSFGGGVYPKLETLSIRGVREKTTVDFPTAFPALKKLTLEALEHPTLPHLPCIEILVCRSCVLNEGITNSLSSLVTLKELGLHGSRFSFVPESIASLTNLQTLDLSKNHFYNYDAQGFFLDDTLAPIANLRHLTSLNISHNYMDEFGMEEGLGQLACPLEYLDVSCNPTTDLPRGFYLQNLKTLRSSIVPSTLQSAVRLETLILHGPCAHYTPYDGRLTEDVRLPPHSLRTVVFDDVMVPSALMEPVMHLVKANEKIQTVFQYS